MIKQWLFWSQSWVLPQWQSQDIRWTLSNKAWHFDTDRWWWLAMSDISYLWLLGKAFAHMRTWTKHFPLLSTCDNCTQDLTNSYERSLITVSQSSSKCSSHIEHTTEKSFTILKCAISLQLLTSSFKEITGVLHYLCVYQVSFFLLWWSLLAK